MPVAPSLRPADERHGATPDMCIPISPNTDHPNGRLPLETTPEFPYRKCYHWSDGDCRLDVRVRSRPEMFDDDFAVTLPASGRVQLWEYMEEDYMRMEMAQKVMCGAQGGRSSTEVPNTGMY